MKTHVARMLRAMSWADQQTLAALEACPDTPTDAVKLLAHMLAAEHVWLARLCATVSRPSPSGQQLDLTGCKRLADENAAGYAAFVAGLDDDGFSTPIRYRNTKGDEFVNSTIDILTQVVIHGAYHRGQIARALGSIGIPAFNTDFITFARSVEPIGN